PLLDGAGVPMPIPSPCLDGYSSGAPNLPPRARTPHGLSSMNPDSSHLACVLADVPLVPAVVELLAGRVEWLPWPSVRTPGAERVEAIYTYGHPAVDADLLAQLPRVRVISNFGVGVDH